MIQEIINFIDTLKPEVLTYNLKPKEGIYVLLDIDENGNLINIDHEGKILESDIGLYSKRDDDFSPVIKKCLLLSINSLPVSNAKIFTPINKVFGNTCSPYAFSFNKKNVDKYNDLSTIRKKLKDNSIKPEELKEKFEAFIRDELNTYFDTAEKYVKDAQQITWYRLFRNYLHDHLFTLLANLDAYEKLKANEGVYFFLKEPTVTDYKIPHQLYLSEKIFNKDDYNKVKPSTKIVYGISDSVSYFNDKKPFLKHPTAPLLYNYRVNGEAAMKIWQFFNMQQNRQLPNPMPIFIDQTELTEKVIEIFNVEKGKIGYVEVIKRILERENDLSNYYLIFFDVKAKKSKVIDIDFVPNFRYEINDMKIVEVFSLNGDLTSKMKIEHVFDFEKKVANRMFNGQLVVKDGTWLKYFAELDASYMTESTYNLLMKYRKAFYDYIYKSRQQAVTKKIFDDIMLMSILEDIRLDDNRENEYSIKTKLNIWFSLYEYFDYTQFNKPLNNMSMVNKTKELIQRISAVATDENEHIVEDYEFAFATGQVIHFLLNKSESGNRTHALLEPFLQKTDVALLKREIVRSFDTYKHAIKFYSKKYEFDKIMSEVMGFEPAEKNMKNLLPFTLAGYFAKSVFSKN